MNKGAGRGKEMGTKSVGKGKRRSAEGDMGEGRAWKGNRVNEEGKEETVEEPAERGQGEVKGREGKGRRKGRWRALGGRKRDEGGR